MNYSDFESLSEEDLTRIVIEQDSAFAVARLKLTDAGHLAGYQDELQRLLFERRLGNHGIADSKVIAELIALPSGSSSQKLIGDLAITDRINDIDLAFVLDTLPESDWSFRQSQARKHILEFLEAEIDSRYGIVQQLFSLKTAWAVQEILCAMSTDELRSVIADVAPSNKRILGRRDRHSIRTRARSILQQFDN